MKIFIFLLSIMSFSLLFNSPASGEKLINNTQVPDFSLYDERGKNRSLSDFRGKYVILEWFNYDCPFVKKHYSSGNMQYLQKLCRDNDVVWLSINSSAHGRQGHYHPKRMRKLAKDRNAKPTAILFDQKGYTGRIYGAKTTPHMYLIDPDGILLYQGAIDSNPSANPADIKGAENYILKALKEIKAGKPVSTPRTKPYGCSVKY